MAAINSSPYQALATAKTNAEALRYPPKTEKKPVAANETAFIWGDPHIVGADGDKYDVNKVGKFNFLEDKGVKFNADFAKFNDKSNVTVIRSTDLTVDGKKINVDASGKVTLDGKELQSNTYKAWGDDNQVSKLRNGNVLIDTGEYTILLATDGTGKNKFLNASVSSGKNGVSADGTAPKGLLGETFDADSTKQTKPKNNINDYLVGAKPKPKPKPDTPPNNEPPKSDPNQEIQKLFQQLLALIQKLFGG